MPTLKKMCIPIPPRKRIGLIAHDHQKNELLEWAEFNKNVLRAHDLFATGTTGRMIASKIGLEVACFRSGPLGGDQQIGAKIGDGTLDFLIFFWDPMQPQPHDPDVKALLRLAVLWNIPVACNRATADFIISSPLMSTEYSRIVTDFDSMRTEKTL